MNNNDIEKVNELIEQINERGYFNSDAEAEMVIRTLHSKLHLSKDGLIAIEKEMRDQKITINSIESLLMKFNKLEVKG